VVRSWVVEDSIVSEVARQPEDRQLALVAAIAQAALIQRDAEFRVMAALGQDPFVWPISPDERRLIDKLHGHYPPAPEAVERARLIVGRLSTGATCDEVAVAAVAAATYFNTIPSIRVRSEV
jgi:hypothetical protein